MTKRWLGWALVMAAALVGPLAQAVDWSARVPTDRERGIELYNRHCLACHGERAKGDGKLAAALVAPVPDLSEGLNAQRMEEMVEVVMRGKGAMPGFEQTFRDLRPHDDDLKRFPRAVIDYMDHVARQGPEAPPDAEVEDDEEEQGDQEMEAPGE